LWKSGFVDIAVALDAVRANAIRFNKHHWGEKKVSVRNVLAMANAVAKDEFDFVKLLPVNRLNGYIQYFPQIWDKHEVNQIVQWCLENCKD
jgi:hypothetical protein